ncbi:MAG: hypothetical protein AB7E72_18210 [Lysobacterales bacterium]
MRLLAELKRRNVIRMAGLYIVGAWLFVQVAETLLPIFDTPAWVLKALVLLLALGFVPALVFSWIFELTPEGLKRDTGAASTDAVGLRTARRLDLLTLVGVVALLALMAADRYWPRAGNHPEASVESGAAADVAAKAPATVGTRPTVVEKSIAVLPFVNMSADPDNEYFSDGISEEILNALTQVRELKVAGRTSSFQFKGRNESLVDIGAALGVAHVLEGSVRKQGDKVRITAQLIHVSDGFHLWSETYDGDLGDIFELQERIARAITGKLEIILQGDQQQRLVPIATDSPEAYALYLQATAIFNRREGPQFAHAIALMQQALTLDPGYARAHSRLGTLYALAPQYASADFKSSVAAAVEHARAAIAIDPNFAEPYAVMGQSQESTRQFVAARHSYQRAVSVEPDDVLSNFWLATMLISSGYQQRGIDYLERTLAIDPLLPNALMWRGAEHVFAGELAEGERQLRLAAQSGLSNVGVGLNHLEQARGNTGAAIDALAQGLEVFMGTFPPGTPRLVAEGSLGDDQQRAEAVRRIEAYLATDPDVVAGAAAYALIRLQQSQRALEVMLRGPTDSDALVFFGLWSPAGAATRRAPEFAQFVEQIGLTQVWDEFGPPDQCRKNAEGAYVCE